MQSKLTRRAVLAGVPAVAAVAALPAIPALAVEHEPLLALWAEYQRAKADSAALSRACAAAEAQVPLKFRSVVGPAFLPAKVRLEYDAAYQRVGLDKLYERSEAQSEIVNDAEQRILTTMPVTVAGAAIVAKALTVALEAGFGWADKTAIENLAVWLERQAGGVA